MNQNHFTIGEKSTVEISSTPDNFLKKIFITCGKSSHIKILGIQVLNSTLGIELGDNCELTIGPNQLMNGSININAHEKSRIVIGEGCLWSDVNIWSSDMHSIIDLASNKRINQAQDIIIDDHVWFGHGSLILKGSIINTGCIVGARSVITKSTPTQPNSVIAGNPAKILKNNVTWQA